ncbi:RimJ/RimL family protein N-acetyltransferase [Kribbella antiqua]|uniref:RimJ/RimL family protein N-acetyltransferase n=1 Tax=Kribbella antiqua TaxID=2512217 RepID=A0A4R2IGI2_9ACTN|nr:GNAT family N-acetyltransferase [Kribbella antiqua]TCO43874.1 RimJ/RimL family protein N-acetyltransferase [Kribbella antiqua]
MRFPEDVPVLTDDVVTLRAARPDDVDPAHRMCQDPEMQRWTTIPVPYERENAVHFLTEMMPAGWRDGGTRGWVIEYDGRFAGSIDLRDSEGGAGEVGFAVAPWARGGGVMTRALKVVVRHAFDDLGWDRVIWRAFVGNWGSRRVAWKCGFRGFVVVPGGGVARGVRHDEWIATIGRDDELEPQGNWWKVPEVERGGFRLRGWRSTDAKRVAEACNDERTAFWLAGLPSPYGVTDAEGFIESRRENLASGEGVSWAIADAESDELLGCVSVFDMNNRIDKTIGEVGYWLHPEARGRGVMSTAVGLAIEQAFKPVAEGGLGRRRLVLFAAEGNTASAHVAEVNGFTRVSTERAAGPLRDGSYTNILGFDLLATDPR